MNLVKGQVESIKLSGLDVERITMMAVAEFLECGVIHNQLLLDLLNAGKLRKLKDLESISQITVNFNFGANS